MNFARGLGASRCLDDLGRNENDVTFRGVATSQEVTFSRLRPFRFSGNLPCQPDWTNQCLPRPWVLSNFGETASNPGELFFVSPQNGALASALVLGGSSAPNTRLLLGILGKTWFSMVLAPCRQGLASCGIMPAQFSVDLAVPALSPYFSLLSLEEVRGIVHGRRHAGFYSIVVFC